MVRQRMIKPFKKQSHEGSLIVVALLLLLASCNPTELTGTNVKSGIISNEDGSLDGKAFIYRDSPSILAGPGYRAKSPNMDEFTDYSSPEFITENTVLYSNCAMDNGLFTVANCMRALVNTDSVQALVRNTNRTYIFPAGSVEFYQVNALYHAQKGTTKFLEKLTFAYDRVHQLSSWFGIPKAIPPYMKSTNMFWFRGVANVDSKIYKNNYLNIYSQCQLENNALFSPAGPDVCLGYVKKYPGLWMVQDPSVIYHELGHGFVSIMLNLRNETNDATIARQIRSDLTGAGYDEAGAINEGIADYFSYMINGRTHFGEWALGKTFAQSRPLSESDPMHVAGIDTTPEGRLSYPHFLLYDPNFPEDPVDDVHYAGQIVSHYLVALSDKFKTRCGLTVEPDGGHETATNYVTLLLAETLAELGDLNARTVDGPAAPYNNPSSLYFNNLDPSNSYLWAHHVNRINYRRFFQVFAKNINKYISNGLYGLCSTFTINESEMLLDDYGLLLFNNYNDHGKSTKDRTKTYSNVAAIGGFALTNIVPSNRRKTVLVSKQLLQLAERNDDTPDAVSYYIIDNRTDMESLVQGLLHKGLTIPFNKNVASVEYNNGNLRISPGELLAIIPNLYNASNSVMAGVQVLATDWDHVDVKDTTTGNFRPCVVDSVTTVDQGGQSSTVSTITENSVTRTNTCNPANGYPDANYQRLTLNRITNLFPSNAAAPVCFVQLEEGNSTKWVSQNEFRKKSGLSLQDKDCLGYQTSGVTDTDFTFNPHECLVRFVPGMNDAFFAKIDPQKNFWESVVKRTNPNDLTEPEVFNIGNILVMEVNRWVPPGTKFRCRLRARFSNCSDCYNDTDPLTPNDYYIDSDYNGHKPFKILNFDFDVND